MLCASLFACSIFAEQSIMVFSPHPDDESLGCGGSIAKHVADGADVAIYFMTSGEAEDAMPQEPYKRAEIREAEARAATAVLGVTDVTFLHFPDGGVQGTGESLGIISRLISNYQPNIIYIPHGNDAHIDHMATHNIVFQAAQKAHRLAKTSEKSQWNGIIIRCFEVWTPLASVNYLEDIGLFMAAKMTALQQYASQLAIVPYHISMEGLNRYRGGMTAHLKGNPYIYAEAFHEKFIN